MAEERSRIDQLLAEYYKLDYEDDVAGIKTRFRWAQRLCRCSQHLPPGLPGSSCRLPDLASAVRPCLKLGRWFDCKHAGPGGGDPELDRAMCCVLSVACWRAAADSVCLCWPASQLPGAPCRYRRVPRAEYGLSTADILKLQDKELNQVVGLKRIAPYRPDEGLVRPNYGKLHELKAGAKGARGSKRREPAQRELQAGAKGAKGSKLQGQQGPAQPTPWTAHTDPAHREEGSAKPAHKNHEKLKGFPATAAAQTGKGLPKWHVEQKPPAAQVVPANGKAKGAVKTLSMAERAAQRLQSYAAPTLAARHPLEHDDHKKHKRPQQQQLQPQEGSQLPKAARKNLRRKMKRQALSAAAEQAAT